MILTILFQPIQPNILRFTTTKRLSKIEVTTDMSVEYLMNDKEWYALSLELDPIEDIRGEDVEPFREDWTNQIRIRKFKFDADGNTISMTHTPSVSQRLTKVQTLSIH